MARNTTIIRSNYLWDESAGIYEHALKLWEGLDEELDYPILFSQRGVLNLAHSLQDVRDSVRRVEANRLNGVDAEWLDAQQVKEVCPIVNISPDVRYPVLGGDLPAARRHRQARPRRLGLRPRRGRAGRRPHPELRGHRHRHGRRPGHRRAHDPGHHRRRAGSRCARPATPRSWPPMVGHRAAAAEPPAAGPGLRAARAGAPDRRDVQRRPRVRQPGAQGRAGDGRRHRLLQLLRPARRVPHHRARRWPRRSSCSRSSPGPTCCGPGPASSTSPPTPRRSSG